MDKLSAFLADWTPRRVMAGTLVIMSVAFVALLMVRFYSVLVIVFIAFVLSTAVRPLVRRLQRFNVAPALGVIFTYLLILGAIVGMIVLVIPLIVDQTAAIGDRIPEYYADLRLSLLRSTSALVRNLSERLPQEPPLEMFGLSSSTAAPSGAAVQQTLGLLSALGKAVFVVVATLLLGFYWTLDGHRITRTLMAIVPAESRANARDLFDEVEAKMGAYIRGQIILDIAVGTMATIAYLIIGLDYALILGILAGVLETVPILGPVLGAVPPALIALSSGNTSAFVGVIIATVVIQQLEGAVLVPRIMDRAVGVNAVVTLLAFAAFTPLLGLIGGILAVPIAAIIQIIFIRVVFTQADVVQTIDRRDRLGVLQYETQELAQHIRTHYREKDESELADKANLREDQLEAIVNDLDELLAQASKQREVPA